MDQTMEAWWAFITSDAGARYIARRVGAAARHDGRERERLNHWLASRAIFNRADAGEK